MKHETGSTVRGERKEHKRKGLCVEGINNSKSMSRVEGDELGGMAWTKSSNK